MMVYYIISLTPAAENTSTVFYTSNAINQYLHWSVLNKSIPCIWYYASVINGIEYLRSGADLPPSIALTVYH